MSREHHSSGPTGGSTTQTQSCVPTSRSRHIHCTSRLKAMKPASAACVIIPLLSLLCYSVNAQTNYHFFPVRPKHVKLLYDYGILVDYSAGNDSAGLSIRRPNGKVVSFYLASPAAANGRPFDVYHCPRRPDCAPPNIHFNKTRVRVTYWMQMAPWGRNEKVSNLIDSEP